MKCLGSPPTPPTRTRSPEPPPGPYHQLPRKLGAHTGRADGAVLAGTGFFFMHISPAYSTQHMALTGIPGPVFLIRKLRPPSVSGREQKSHLCFCCCCFDQTGASLIPYHIPTPLSGRPPWVPVAPSRMRRGGTDPASPSPALCSQRVN